MKEIIKASKINQIIERLAYQIAEHHSESKELILLGIESSGYILAHQIFELLNPIIPNVSLHLNKLTINKKNPLEKSIDLDADIHFFENKSIIVVDDVINSGRTLFYALRPFFLIDIQMLQTLVLVERKYKRFPISADYVGVSLNTTFKEHIEVICENGKVSSVSLK
jgi:pyrimidine operon attenuation protein/uracil phosphoribosyltransferase